MATVKCRPEWLKHLAIIFYQLVFVDKSIRIIPSLGGQSAHAYIVTCTFTHTCTTYMYIVHVYVHELTSSKQRCPGIAGLSGPTMSFSCTCKDPSLCQVVCPASLWWYTCTLCNWHNVYVCMSKDGFIQVHV